MRIRHAMAGFFAAGVVAIGTLAGAATPASAAPASATPVAAVHAVGYPFPLCSQSMPRTEWESCRQEVFRRLHPSHYPPAAMSHCTKMSVATTAMATAVTVTTTSPVDVPGVVLIGAFTYAGTYFFCSYGWI